MVSSAKGANKFSKFWQSVSVELLLGDFQIDSQKGDTLIENLSVMVQLSSGRSGLACVKGRYKVGFSLLGSFHVIALYCNSD